MWALALFACVCGPEPAPADPLGDAVGDAPSGVVRRSGVRIVVDEERVQLQAPVLQWPDQPGRIVGAVHVGEPAYYAQLTAQLTPPRVVLYEGLTADEPDEPGPPAPDLGPFDLARQSEAVPHDDRWIHADTTLSALRQALVDSGAPADVIHAMLDDRDQNTLADLFGEAGEPRLQALARLALIRHVGAPSPVLGNDADAYWNVIVGWRNAQVRDALEPHLHEDWAVVYGADHAWDLAQRIRPDAEPQAVWLPVIQVDHTELGLGAVQVRQLLAE